MDKNCTQDKTLCSNKVCLGKDGRCDYLHKQYGMSKWVFRLIISTIFCGAIVPFASEVICTLWFPDASIGLATWNQFVSIILGIIATILSIVSIIMGFKNYEDTLQVQEKYMQALDGIGEIAKDLANVREDVNRMTSLQDRIPLASQVKVPEIWDAEPEQI